VNAPNVQRAQIVPNAELAIAANVADDLIVQIIVANIESHIVVAERLLPMENS
jgi:hypothetical protein